MSSASHAASPQHPLSSKYAVVVVLFGLVLAFILGTGMSSRSPSQCGSICESSYDHADRMHHAHYASYGQKDLHIALASALRRQLRNPHDPEIIAEKAIILEYMELWSDAAAAYRQAICLWNVRRADPDESPVVRLDAPHRIALLQLYLGDTLMHCNQSQQAKAAFAEALGNPITREDARRRMSALER